MEKASFATTTTKQSKTDMLLNQFCIFFDIVGFVYIYFNKSKLLRLRVVFFFSRKHVILFCLVLKIDNNFFLYVANATAKICLRMIENEKLKEQVNFIYLVSVFSYRVSDLILNPTISIYNNHNSTKKKTGKI